MTVARKYAGRAVMITRLAQNVAEVIYWWACVAAVRGAGDVAGTAGPWWCKVILLAAVLAIPGQVDEVVLFAVLAALRKRRASKAAAQACSAQQ